MLQHSSGSTAMLSGCSPILCLSSYLFTLLRFAKRDNKRRMLRHPILHSLVLRVLPRFLRICTLKSGRYPFSSTSSDWISKGYLYYASTITNGRRSVPRRKPCWELFTAFICPSSRWGSSFTGISLLCQPYNSASYPCWTFHLTCMTSFCAELLKPL